MGSRTDAPRPGAMSHCPNCGATATPGASFCSTCGRPFAAAPVPAPPSWSAAAPYALPAALPRARPVGVTIVGIVSIVGGIGMAFAAVAALFILLLGATFADAMTDTFVPWMPSVPGALMATLAVIAFLFLGAMAGLAIAAGVGSLRGRAWGWVLTLVAMGLVALDAGGGILAGAVEDVLGLLVAGLVVWYYFTPDVRAWFGRV